MASDQNPVQDVPEADLQSAEHRAEIGVCEDGNVDVRINSVIAVVPPFGARQIAGGLRRIADLLDKAATQGEGIIP